MHRHHTSRSNFDDNFVLQRNYSLIMLCALWIHVPDKTQEN